MNDKDERMFGIRKRVMSELPDEYKKHVLYAAREEFGIALVKELLKVKQPCIISISEDIKEVPSDLFQFCGDYDEIRIETRITPTLNKYSTVYSVIYMAPKIEKLSFLQRLRYVMTGKTPPDNYSPGFTYGMIR